MAFGRYNNMKKLVRYIFLCLMILCFAPLRAQADIQTSMYWAVPTQFNPSMAGCDSAINVIVSHRLQWTGLDKAPQRTFIAGDSPYQFGNKRLGFGVNLLQDRTKYFESSTTSGQASYSLKLFGGRLAVGLQFGAVRMKFNGSRISSFADGFGESSSTEASDTIPNPDYETLRDSLPHSDVSGSGFDIGLGLYYERKVRNSVFYGGFSVMHLNEPALITTTTGQNGYQKEVFRLPSTIYFIAGCNIYINNALFVIQPSVLVRSNSSVTETDFTLRTTFKNRFWCGVSYRTNDALILMAGANIKAFRLYYSYDMGISGIAKTSKGSHEFMASYSYKMELEKKKRHPHKSIRLL